MIIKRLDRLEGMIMSILKTNWIAYKDYLYYYDREKYNLIEEYNREYKLDF